MAIFNTGGGGILLDYDVKFTPNSLELKDSNTIIQVNTDLSTSKIIQPTKKALIINKVDTASGTNKPDNSGFFSKLHSSSNLNNKKNNIIYYSQSDNIKGKSLTAYITIAAATAKTLAAGGQRNYVIKLINNNTLNLNDFVISFSNNVPAEGKLGYEIIPKEEQKTEDALLFTISESSLATSGVDITKACYLVISALNTTASIIKGNYSVTDMTGGVIADNKETLVAGTVSIRDGIIYNKDSYYTKYIEVQQNHVYCFVNKEKNPNATFVYYKNTQPIESINGNPLYWEDTQKNLWKVPYTNEPNDKFYLAYCYAKNEIEPIIEDYTIEYYLPKLYPTKAENWIPEWFFTDYIDVTCETQFNDIEKKLYRFVIDEYGYKQWIQDTTYFNVRQESFVANENKFTSLRTQNWPIFKVIDGQEVEIGLNEEFNNTISYHYYEKKNVRYYYNEVTINDWFNENSINNWVFNSSDSDEYRAWNATEYSLQINNKLYWIQIGSDYKNQNFNAIKSEENPINLAVTGIYSWFDISPILKNIGGTFFKTDTELVQLSLQSIIHLYDPISQSYTSIEILNTDEAQTSLASYIEGNLTEVIDKNARSIAENTFNGDTKITGVNLPICTSIKGTLTISSKKVTSNTYPLQNCTNLKRLLLPKWEPYTIGTSPSAQIVLGSNAYQNQSPFRGLNQLTEVACGIRDLPNATLYTSNKVIKNLSTTHFPFLAAKDNLQKIQLPQCLNIGDYNFYSFFTNLETVELYNNPFDQDTTITIGQQAFYNCSNLKDINLNHVIDVGQQAFYNCSNLNNIHDLTLATRIQSSAFYSCSALNSTGKMLKDVEIQEYAFTNCISLTALDAIKCNLFGRDNCAFKWGIDGTNFNPIFGCAALNTIKLGVTDNIPANFFTSASFPELQTVNFPNVSTIAQSAFQNLSKLTNVGLDSISIIPESAFEQCISLTHINSIEEGNIGLQALNVSYIEQRAFSGCTNLKEINLPYTNSSIEGTYLGTAAFYGCTALESINIAQCIPNSPIFDEVNGPFVPGWNNFSKLQYLKLNNLSPNINSLNKIPTDQLNYFEMDKIESLPANFFKEKTEIHTIKCDSVTTLNESCFANLEKTVTINLNENDNEITTVNSLFNLPSLTTIKEKVFENTQIEYADLRQVQEIGDYAFRNSGIKHIDINLTNKSNYIDNEQKAQNCLFISTKLEKIGESAFNNTDDKGIPMPYIETLNLIPKNSDSQPKFNLEIGARAFKQSLKIKELNFDEINSLIIGEDAFSNNSSLTTVEIKPGSGLEKLYIGSKAFANCNGLTSFITSVTLSLDPNDSYVISNDIFEGNDNLKNENGLYEISTYEASVFEEMESKLNGKFKIIHLTN